MAAETAMGAAATRLLTHAPPFPFPAYSASSLKKQDKEASDVVVSCAPKLQEARYPISFPCGRWHLEHGYIIRKLQGCRDLRKAGANDFGQGRTTDSPVIP